MSKFKYQTGDYIITFQNGKKAEIYCHTQTEVRFLLENIFFLKEVKMKEIVCANNLEKYSFTK